MQAWRDTDPTTNQASGVPAWQGTTTGEISGSDGHRSNRLPSVQKAPR